MRLVRALDHDARRLKRPEERSPVVRYYGCSYHQTRGRMVCSNGLRVRMSEADALVLDHMRQWIRPDVISEGIDAAIASSFERELASLSASEPTELDLRRLRKSFGERIGRFDELLVSDVPLARQALRKLIPEGIRFIPEERDGVRAYRLQWGISAKPLIEEGYIASQSPSCR